MSDSEQAQLIALCERMGAPRVQAETMARQLARRADQLATERGIPRVQAMEYLLRVLVMGRNGEGPEGPVPPEPGA